MAKEQFCPTFLGCVKKDLRVARALHRLYQEKLEHIAAYLYGNVVTGEAEVELSVAFEELSERSTGHFRLLGRLILALGSDPVVQLRSSLKGVGIRNSEAEKEDSLQDLLYAMLQKERHFYEHCRELLACIEDGVVRSVLCYLQEEGIEQIQKLSAMVGG